MRVVWLVVLQACSPSSSGVDAGRWFDPELSGCELSLPAPQTVDDVIDRVNRLPRPVSVACFTASLPRPLRVAATTSQFSAQPAQGQGAPRLFFLGDGLVLSEVHDGPGKDLLELGELRAANQTLKAELVFPVTGAVTRESAYSHLEFSPTLTTCGLCHQREEADPAHRWARVSVALKPPARTLVKLDSVRARAAACDVAVDRQRCVRWAALFEFGEVVEGAFPTEFDDFVK